MKRFFTFFLLIALTAGSVQAKIYKLISPDGRTAVEVDVQHQITWRVTHAGQPVIAPSVISMTVAGKEIGYNARVRDDIRK